MKQKKQKLNCGVFDYEMFACMYARSMQMKNNNNNSTTLADAFVGVSISE